MDLDGRRFAWAIAIPFLMAVCGWDPGSLGSRPLRADERMLENEFLDGPPNTLVRADKFLANGQFADAVQMLRQVMEDEGEHLVRVESRRDGFSLYIPLRVYCNRRLARLATENPAALQLYRSQVDPLAERWFSQALANHDARKLRRVIDQLFASSYGDDALLHYGEYALGSGRFAEARYAWCQLDEALQPNKDVVVFPDSEIDLAQVRARLCLAAILAGSHDVAASELETLRSEHAEATGRIGGQTGKYVDLLADFLQKHRTPPPRPVTRWETLGGSQSRQRQARGSTDIALRPIWTYELPKVSRLNRSQEVRVARPAESWSGLLGYHPIVLGDEVIVDTGLHPDGIVSLDLRSGQRLWSTGQMVEPVKSEVTGTEQATVGVPRFTLSAEKDIVFAKVGSPITGFGEHVITQDRGVLVGLDRQADGKLLFAIRPEKPLWDERWAFDGVPLVQRDRLYVALRHVEAGGVQLYVACFDLRGRFLWRSGMVASAEAMTQANRSEITNNLLTLRDDRVYLNTNLGAVACIDAVAGNTLWIARYPRIEVASDQYGRVTKHFLRDLNPVLIEGNQAIVAPADSNVIFALDCHSGEVLWTTDAGVAEDAVHLLGVSHNRLIASGDQLYWIDLKSGNVFASFPDDGDRELRGYGRGLIVNDEILWPTYDELYLFDAQTAKMTQQPKNLSAAGARGGNLLLVNQTLLIASADRLYAFNVNGVPVQPE